MINSPSSEDPIFIWAIPRSGGTLLTLMMDSHPQVAMSYEIYDDLLSGVDGRYLSVSECIRELTPSRSAPRSSSAREALNAISTPNLRTFTARAMRAGLTHDDVALAFRSIGERWPDFGELAARQELIETLMKAKAAQSQTPRWGGKTRSNLEDLYSRYPTAGFLMMYRDFRDVYSSRKSHGFDHLGDVRNQTEDWMLTLSNFIDFAGKTGATAMVVDYERLCKHPEWSLKQVCVHLGLQFNESMLHFASQRSALLDNSYGHLSAEQLRKGLNDHSIGRYTGELTRDESAQIMQITRGFNPKCFVNLGDGYHSLVDDHRKVGQ